VKFAKGLYYSVLTPGSGKVVTKQYIKSLSTAWTSKDGKTQYNAKEDGIDVSDPDMLAEMVPGLAMALKSTPIGETRRWWIVSGLMKPGWGGMVQGDYTVDIEVLAELDPLPAPATVAKASNDALTSETGLRYKVLKQGKNGKKPTASDIVRVHYSGWTPDGKMFDSSVLRERQIEFPLNRVIKGWSEGLQYMSVGDKYRFWIPGELAYDLKPRPGAPKGDLVFDVELFEIIPAK
jgi:peptidylprolyl isomerase